MKDTIRFLVKHTKLVLVKAFGGMVKACGKHRGAETQRLHRDLFKIASGGMVKARRRRRGDRERRAVLEWPPAAWLQYVYF